MMELLTVEGEDSMVEVAEEVEGEGERDAARSSSTFFPLHAEAVPFDCI